ncbi:hypothetical protein LCGC14_2724360, partial [marine sediment metagenome]
MRAAGLFLPDDLAELFDWKMGLASLLLALDTYPGSAGIAFFGVADLRDQSTVAELELTNIEIVNTRVEQYANTTPFDTITARAFSRMEQMLDQSSQLCA